MKYVLLVALALQGCAASTRLSTDWVTSERLSWDAAKYPDDAAVVLYRADRTVIDGLRGETEELRHAVVAVLREGGFDLAEVRVPFRAKQELVVLKARVIQPDGTTRELAPKDFLSDTNGKGERDTQARFFRFPDVRLGSVLEYVWVVRSPWTMGSDSQDTLGEVPVREYDFELVGSRSLVLETIEYNSTQPIAVQTLDDGSHRLRFSLRDLPAREREPWMPQWTFTEPRWAWRLVAYKVSTMITNDWFRTWADVVEGLARRAWVDPQTFAGLTARPDLSSCRDAACKIELTTRWIREKTTTLGVDTNRESKLSEAFDSGRASAKERALIVRRVLEEAGVDARLAFTTARLARQTTESFPEFEQFDRLLVWIPAQPSVPRPFAIDLEPEYLEAGRLPPRVQGQRAFVFWEAGSAIGRPDTRGEWVTLDGADPGPQLQRIVHHAKLDAEGALIDEAALEARGEWAESWQRRHRDSAQRALQETLDHKATATSPLARYEAERWTECSGLKGVCGLSWTMRTPKFAARDGKAWLVPLRVLDEAYEYFPTRARRHDLHVTTDGFFEEVLELDAPPGFHVAQLPDPISASGAGVSVRVVAERTKTGVRLSRRSSFTCSSQPAADYPKFRAALAPFLALRNSVLQFDPD